MALLEALNLKNTMEKAVIWLTTTPRKKNDGDLQKFLPVPLCTA